MKKIHHIWLTVHSKPEDNEELILNNLKKFFPFNLEEENIKINTKKATSVKERIIAVLQVHLEKTRHINSFLKNLNSILTDEQKQLLITQVESRLDEGNHFFIRFDKDILINENRFYITDKGNCYHLKMSIATFPTTREKALKIIKELFT